MNPNQKTKTKSLAIVLEIMKHFFSENEHVVDLYRENDTIVNEIPSESKTLEKAKYKAKQEVLPYLIAT